MSTEDGEEKTCYMYSPSAAGAGRSPRIVDILVVASALPRLEHLPWIDIFRGSGVCFDNIFWLLLHGLFFSFAFCFRVHAAFSTSTCQVFLRGFFSTAHGCTCTQHDNTFQQEEYQSTSRLENADEKNSNKRNSLYKRNWHLFRPRPQLLSHIWHPFVTPVTAPCSARPHRAGTSYARKAEISAFSQLTQASTSRSVHRKSLAWCSSWKTTELHHSSVVWLYCCTGSTLARSIIESPPPIVRLTLTPRGLASPQGQVSLAG